MHSSNSSFPKWAVGLGCFVLCLPMMGVVLSMFVVDVKDIPWFAWTACTVLMLAAISILANRPMVLEIACRTLCRVTAALRTPK